MENLRALRKASGLTQIELCEKLNIAQATLWGYETGAHEPDIDTILKIADYFGVSIDYLFGRSDSHGSKVEHIAPSALPEKEEEILQHFRKLSPALQDAAIETVRVLAGVPSEGGLQKKA